MVEPPVEAPPVEHVAARQHPDLVPLLEVALAHHTAVSAVVAAVVYDGVGVEESVVDGELIGEHDESGESGSDGGEETFVDDLVGVEP